MAKKITPRRFLSQIGTDPEKLGRFILDPEGMMNEHGILKKHRHHIKNAVAQAVHKTLSGTPEAYICIIL
jgi:hypothetical protein